MSLKDHRYNFLYPTWGDIRKAMANNVLYPEPSFSTYAFTWYHLKGQPQHHSDLIWVTRELEKHKFKWCRMERVGPMPQAMFMRSMKQVIEQHLDPRGTTLVVNKPHFVPTPDGWRTRSCLHYIEVSRKRFMHKVYTTQNGPIRDQRTDEGYVPPTFAFCFDNLHDFARHLKNQYA